MYTVYCNSKTIENKAYKVLWRCDLRPELMKIIPTTALIWCFPAGVNCAQPLAGHTPSSATGSQPTPGSRQA